MDRLHWTPVGPLPAAVYWRRRAAVLLGVLTVLLLLLQLGGSEDDATLDQAAPAAPITPSAAGTRSASPAPSGDVPACAPEDLRVQADTAPADVPSGSGASVRVAVTNTSDAPCSVRLGDGAVELLVVSGRDRIWSSDDCDEGAAEDGRADLAPGERRLLEEPWDGRRSRPGCEQGEVARPGTYRVLARVGSVQVEGRAFRVG